MNVLIACEESQAVCKAFRERGHNAFSCDIQECSGGHPEWHIKDNVLMHLNPTRWLDQCDYITYGYRFRTQDGKEHEIEGKWDLIIAHPPCTYLTTAATRAHSLKTYTKEQIADRTMKRIEAMEFFMCLINADCERIVVENPAGVMSACYRKPDQTIHPWYFAESTDDENYATKRTQLWLKGVEPLKYTITLPDPLENAERWSNGKKKCWTEQNHGGKTRSKTFPGIAKAMAEQWG